jgi:hypothetical protein
LIKGVIGKISKKPYSGKTLTSFALKGQDGWYSLGERSLPYNEGDSIQFNVETRGNYSYAQQIEPWNDGGAGTPSVGHVAASAPSRDGEPKPYRRSFQGGNKSGGSAKDDFWNDKEKRDIERERYQREVTQPKIEIQAARNAAIETAKFMFEKELVKVPTKTADKYDAFLELVETLTGDFISRTQSRLDSGDGSDTAATVGERDDRELQEEPNTKGAW